MIHTFPEHCKMLEVLVENCSYFQQERYKTLGALVEHCSYFQQERYKMLGAQVEHCSFQLVPLDCRKNLRRLGPEEHHKSLLLLVPWAPHMNQ